MKTCLPLAASLALLAAAASAQCGSNSLATPFTANNGGSNGWGVFVDLQVTNPLGVVVCAIDTNAGTTAVSTPFTVDVYVTPTSYLSVHGVPAAWRLVATGSGVAAGSGVPALTTMAQPFHLPAGSYGLAFYHYGVTSVRYTNGTGSNQNFSNADLAITAGLVRSTFFGTPTAGSTFTPRVWNGGFYYDVPSPTSLAGAGFFAAGCAGSLGISKLSASAAPRLGTVISLNIDNLPMSAGVLMTGFSNTMSVFGPLPLNLGLFGAPACSANVNPDATLFVFGSGNTASTLFGIPNSTAVQALALYNQALVLDPGVNALGGVTSDALALSIGL
jgi:hypothetical protein